MLNKEKFIKSYFDEAKHYIELANLSIEKKKYNTVIRNCQTSIELSIKALILKFGLVIPKVHNLRQELQDIKELLSNETKINFEKIYMLSNRLYAFREDSLYGDIELNQSPDEIFSKEKAEKYLKETKEVIEVIEKELKDFL